MVDEIKIKFCENYDSSFPLGGIEQYLLYFSNNAIILIYECNYVFAAVSTPLIKIPIKWNVSSDYRLKNSEILKNGNFVVTHFKKWVVVIFRLRSLFLNQSIRM